MERHEQAIGDAVVRQLGEQRAGAAAARWDTSERVEKATKLRRGYWMGGKPPFGTRRVSASTGLEVSTNDFEPAGVVLEPDPDALLWWKDAAEMVVAGRSLRDVRDMLTKAGIRGSQGAGWTTVGVRRMLTHPALIGRVTDGEKSYLAAWPPMVDLDLFAKVCRAIYRLPEVNT